jgi:hypothetical protein
MYTTYPNSQNNGNLNNQYGSNQPNNQNGRNMNAGANDYNGANAAPSVGSNPSTMYPNQQYNGNNQQSNRMRNGSNQIYGGTTKITYLMLFVVYVLFVCIIYKH